MKDFRGQEIHVGDVVVYSSSQWMNEARVEAVGDGFITVSPILRHKELPFRYQDSWRQANRRSKLTKLSGVTVVPCLDEHGNLL